MTNREYMQSLSDEDFEMCMHFIYFNSNCLTKNGSTPSWYTVLTWLKGEYNNEFWKSFNEYMGRNSE